VARTCQGPRLGQAREPGAAANFLAHLNYFFAHLNYIFALVNYYLAGLNYFFAYKSG
jgi:hypothetical protein